MCKLVFNFFKKRKIDFVDIQENFDPFKIDLLDVSLCSGISVEIGKMNEQIDKTLENYFSLEI